VTGGVSRPRRGRPPQKKVRLDPSYALASATDFQRWHDDPVAFCEEALFNPETGLPFVLTEAERVFLRVAFQRTSDGRLMFPELLFGAPKKSGKTAFSAMLILYVVLILGPRYSEAYCCSNDLEQSKGRVFQACQRIVAASPLLAADAEIGAQQITFRSSGSTITALASDWKGSAGANPIISSFDELWAFTSESALRLWDEMVPPPTRLIACRLTTTYAGYEGESSTLEPLYKRGIAGERIAPDLYAQSGMLCFWTNRFTAPWQTEAWREQMRGQLRPNAFLRLVENRWVTGAETFIPTEAWDECVDRAMTPVVANPGLSVWVGVDASVKRDSTAIAVCTWDAETKRVKLAAHRIFQPSPDDPLDFEVTVEATLREMMRWFAVQAIRYDPFQMVAVAQRLRQAGLPMYEFPQTVGNLTESSTNLYELIKGRNLVAYPDPEIRLAMQRAVAVETSRGWRVAKEKASHKIDIVVALGMAALGAVQSGQAAALTFPNLEPLTGLPGHYFDELGHQIAGPLGPMNWDNRG
jgi:phage terminase large subunit-like protein